jgi:regulator of protease activity HflC (stomatin/prohibitin superfamily)
MRGKTMADIRTYPFFSHLRADPTSWVQHQQNGKVRRAGAGQSFWFRPDTAALAEVPLDDREQAVHFHARTADFQVVTVASTVTYRVEDPQLAATRTDFGISPRSGKWNAVPLETLGGLLSELAQQPAIELVAELSLAEALARGIGPIRERVSTALAADDRLHDRGLRVIDVRVVSVRTDADVERALQTETRERIQGEADKATFARRALAVEQESAIAENELTSQIEIARREQELVAQQGANERLRATEHAAAEQIAASATAERDRLQAETRAAGLRSVGQAEADAQAALLAAHAGVDQSMLNSLVLKELVANLPELPNLTTLTVTPDVLAAALEALVGRRER